MSESLYQKRASGTAVFDIFYDTFQNTFFHRTPPVAPSPLHVLLILWICLLHRDTESATADLVTFTEEILNGKLLFCAVYCVLLYCVVFYYYTNISTNLMTFSGEILTGKLHFFVLNGDVLEEKAKHFHPYFLLQFQLF